MPTKIYTCIAIPKKSDWIERYKVGREYELHGEWIMTTTGDKVCTIDSNNAGDCMRESSRVACKLMSL